MPVASLRDGSGVVTAAAMVGGFADPVFHSQRVFRAVMDALAQPGTVSKLPQLCNPPAPLNAAAGAIALTLCDQDTPVWIDKALKLGPDVTHWLAFQTGAPLVDFAADAAFAFVSEAGQMSPLDMFAQGTQDYPDRSTTIVVQVPSLAGGPTLRLRGPGIETEATIAPKGLPPHFLQQWSANRNRFPRGVDVVLAAADRIVGLPRTVRVMKEG